MNGAEMMGKRRNGLFWGVVLLAATTYIYDIISAPGHAFRQGGTHAVTEIVLQKSQDRVVDIHLAQANPATENEALLTDLRNQVHHLASENARLKRQLETLHQSSFQNNGIANLPSPNETTQLVSSSAGPAERPSEAATASSTDDSKDENDLTALHAGLRGSGRVDIRYSPLP